MECLATAVWLLQERISIIEIQLIKSHWLIQRIHPANSSNELIQRIHPVNSSNLQFRKLIKFSLFRIFRSMIGQIFQFKIGSPELTCTVTGLLSQEASWFLEIVRFGSCRHDDTRWPEVVLKSPVHGAHSGALP